MAIFATINTHAQQLQVMTYNIRYDTKSDGVNHWPLRRDKVYDLIRKYNPDILGIQEALANQVDDLSANLPQYTVIGVGRDDGERKGEFSAILYKKDRFTTLSSGTFWLSETPDVPGSKNWDAAITRIATWARFKDNASGKEFLSLNTHFDHVGKVAQEKSAGIIKTKAAALAGDIPVIITGDFNIQRHEAPYKVMITPGSLPLTDPAPATPPGTFCTFKVNAQTCNPIDYIFLSAHWATTRYEVITDNDGTYYPSDHLPVLTAVEIK